MRLVEQIVQNEHKSDFRTRYIKYRSGRLKHQYWLWNRKRPTKVVDSYDAAILEQCKPGKIAFFSSSGYYLKDIWPEIDSIELYSVVSEFCKNVITVSSRKDLHTQVTHKYDNFAVVNNRSDHWVTVDGLTEHLLDYSSILNDGARVFYSFRDTQILYNRLTVNAPDYFLNWAISLEKYGYRLVWSDIRFEEKIKEHDTYSPMENPDTTNGNLKFWFEYKGNSWKI